MTRIEIAVHLARRYDHNPDIPIRINPSQTKPLSKEEVVRREGVDYAQSKFLSPAGFSDKSAQGRGVRDTQNRQPRRQGNSVTVPTNHQASDTGTSNRAQTVSGPVRQPDGCLRGVQLTKDNLVPNSRPADLTTEIHFKILCREQPQLLRDNQRSAINQRQKANP